MIAVWYVITVLQTDRVGEKMGAFFTYVVLSSGNMIIAVWYAITVLQTNHVGEEWMLPLPTWYTVKHTLKDTYI